MSDKRDIIDKGESALGCFVLSILGCVLIFVASATCAMAVATWRFIFQ